MEALIPYPIGIAWNLMLPSLQSDLREDDEKIGTHGVETMVEGDGRRRWSFSGALDVVCNLPDPKATQPNRDETLTFPYFSLNQTYDVTQLQFL